MNKRKSSSAVDGLVPGGIQPEKAAPAGIAFEAGLLQAIGHSVIATDISGRVTYWNEAATLLYGWTAPEALGKSILDLTPTITSRQQAEEILATLRRGETYSGDFQVQRKNGAYFTAHVTDTPLLDAEGNLYGIIGISWDVTPLRNRETEMATLLDNTDESFILLDKDLVILSFNLACKTLYRFLTRREMMTGHSILDYSEPARRPELTTIYKAVLSGEKRGYEIDMTTPSGDKCYYSLSYKPARDNSGDITGVFVSAVDITAMKNSAALVQRSERRFRALVENGHDAVMLADERGKLFYASPTVLHLTGYSDEAVQGKDWLGLVHPSDLALLHQALDEARRFPDKPLTPIRLRMLHRDGDYRWLESTVTNLLHNPDVSGIVMNVRDITGEVQAEKALEEQRTVLAEAEANYREIFQKASDAILVHDIQTGNVIDMNDRAATMLGIESGSWKSRPPDVFSRAPETYNTAGALKKIRLAATAGAQVFEWQLFNTNGVMHWVEVSLTPAIVAGQQRVLAFVRDIESRKRAETQKADAERDRAALINSTSELIWSVDAELRLVAANESFVATIRQNTGITIRPGDSLMMKDAFPDDWLAVWKNFYDRALGGESFTEELFTPASIGQSESWSEIKFTPIRNEETVTGIACYFRNITLAKLAATREKEMAEQRQLFESIVHSSGDAIISTGPDGCITSWNNGAEKIFGYGAAGMIGKPLSAIIPEPQRQAAAPASAFPGGVRTFDTEIHSAGNSIYLSVSISPLAGPDGKVTGSAVIARDITAAKLAREKIVESESRLAAAQQVAKVGSWEVHLDTMAVRLSAETFRIFELDPDMPGLTYEVFLGHVHPFDRDRADAAFLSSFDTTGDHRLEHRIITPGGSEKVVEERWRIVRDDTGKALKAIGTCQDVTERKRSAQSDAFKVKLLNTVGQATIATDNNGIITYWNQAAESIYGWTATEAIGKNMQELNPAVIDPSQFGQVLEALQQGKTWEGELPACRKNGELFPVFITYSPVTDEDNRFAGILSVSTDSSERKQIEQELIVNEQQLSVIYNSITDSFFLLSVNDNDEFIFISVNRNFYETVGMLPEHLLGKKASAVIPPESWPMVLQNYQKAIATRSTVTWEETTAYPVGIKTGLVSVTPVFDDTGKCFRMVGSVHDITGRIHAEILVRNSEERYRTLFEQSLAGFYETDLKGRLVNCNLAFAHMLKYESVEEVLALPADSLYLSPGDRHSLVAAITRGARIQNHEAVMRCRDGSLVYSLENLISRFDSVSAATRIDGIVLDITDKKQNELALLHSNDRYNLVARATSDVTWDWNLETGEVFRSVENMQKLFGYPPEIYQGTINFWMEHIHPDDRKRVDAVMESGFTQPGATIIEAEYQFKRADGSYADVSDKGYIIRDTTGKPVRMIGAVQDVTKLRQNERLLSKRAAELAESNRELEQFAYVASHDLQEPLRMVTGFLTQLQKKYEGQLDADAKKFIHFAVDGARRMRQIILDLLEYSRVGRQETERQEVDLNLLLKEIEVLYQQQITEKQAVIGVDRMPVVKGNKSPLRQVFQNLISNALTFTRPGVVPEIRVSAKDKGSHWQFEVEDNGIGISSEYFDRIFLLFQRLHTRDAYPGTGMGLAISRKIIEAMDGEIWVKAEEGKGSRFFFTLKK